MPTDEERREVAARLRRYLSYAIKHDADEHVDACIHGNAMFRNIAQAVGGGISNITDTYEETLIKLIGLIEPEPERTCTLTNMRWDDGMCTWGTKCSECGARFEHETGECWKYCPSCGAKVTEVVS